MKIGGLNSRKNGIYHNWGMHMLKYCVRNDLRMWWRLRKDPNQSWYRKELTNSIDNMKWENAAWWRIWNGNFAKFLLKHSPPELPKPVNIQEECQ